MKNIYTFFILTFLFYTTSSAQNIDCNGIPNGPAVVDPCGTCQLAYIYNTITHSVTFLNETQGVTTSGSEMLVNPQMPGNPYWNDCGNTYAVDCNNFVYGPALIDSCGICRQAYIYDVVDHTVTMINHPDGYSSSLLATEIIVMPDDPSNPYWNDCFTSSLEESLITKNVLKTIDYLGREININDIKFNSPYIVIYEDGSIDKKMKIK